MAIVIEGRQGPVRAFFSWWLGELRGLLGIDRRRRRRRGKDLVLLYHEGAVTGALVGREQVTQLGSFVLPDKGRPIAGALPTALARQRGRAPVTLRLAAAHGLVARDMLPASAEGDLRAILGHKIDLLTPWTREEVRIAPEIEGRREDGRLAVAVSVVPKAVLDEVRDRLAELGLRVRHADLAGEDPWAPPGPDLLGGAEAANGGSRSGGLVAVLVLLAALVYGGWAAVALYSGERTLESRLAEVARLEAQMADLPELRKELDELRDQRSFVASQLRDRPSAAVTLEALTRALPDSVWLADLALSNGEIQITGYAANAAHLLPLLESTRHFADVRFRAPSTKTSVEMAPGQRRELERFSIAAKVQPTTELEP
ncbi:PilN domain-containing protein [Geminicoccaceae bacterium 1502E]|nr:PilN domain-containing protein [Geminicoccaceae bacterium 1502E]